MSSDRDDRRSKHPQSRCSDARAALLIISAVIAFAAAGAAGYDIWPFVFPALFVSVVAAIRLAHGVRAAGLVSLAVGLAASICSATIGIAIDPSIPRGVLVVVLALIFGPLSGAILWVLAEIAAFVIRRSEPNRAGEDEERTTEHTSWRFRFQSSLWARLWVVVLVSLQIGYCCFMIQHVRRKQNLSHTIRRVVQRLGGTAEKHSSENDEMAAFFPQQPLYMSGVDLSRTAVTDAHLSVLQNVHFCSLDLSHTSITDSGMKHIGQVREVFRLDLSNTDITDSGLRHLARMKGVRILVLANTRISDDGLLHLTRLDLWTLDLSNTEVSDAGVRNLGTMQLGELYLQNTKVTDSALVELQRWRDPCEIDVRGTKVTKEGLSRLRRTLPDIRIVEEGK